MKKSKLPTVEERNEANKDNEEEEEDAITTLGKRYMDLKATWWGNLTEREHELYHERPAYISMRNYVESNGDEAMLLNCTFRYIVQAMKKTLKIHDRNRLAVAMWDWKLGCIERSKLHGYYDTLDTVGIAQELIDLNVLDQPAPPFIIYPRFYVDPTWMDPHAETKSEPED
ncbi:uncharacterized protein LOC114574710 [Exaiptasia diaphana]|uniref:Uncharacterized protein n=1 Tax=Exaiptasia diaphana TaxID=2652724 RepID=A0A913YH63_EXADI|nr:uncharacterized protein LOC114574710 [Exaiptasia diaphana]